MISIIVPVYNTYEYLDRCISSLANQSYTDIEILLIDDGSTDQSGSLCDGWATRDKRVHVIHKENEGLIPTWKRGVNEAHGEILCFVDSDDWVDTNMLAEMMSKWSDGLESQIVSSDYVIEREQTNGSFTQEYVYQKLSPGIYEGDTIEKNVFPFLLGNEERYIVLSRCMKLISRNLILNNMVYTDESIRMGEDLSVILPSLYDAQRLVVMDHKAYYHYFYKKDSMVHKYDAGMYDNFIHLKDVCQKKINDKFANDPDTINRQLENLDKEFLYWLLLCVKNEARGNGITFKKNICQIYSLQEDLIEKCNIKVNNPANKLVYWTLKHPTWFRLSILRMAMIIYYR